MMVGSHVVSVVVVTLMLMTNNNDNNKFRTFISALNIVVPQLTTAVTPPPFSVFSFSNPHRWGAAVAVVAVRPLGPSGWSATLLAVLEWATKPSQSSSTLNSQRHRHRTRKRSSSCLAWKSTVW